MFLVGVLFWIIAAIHLCLAIRDRMKSKAGSSMAARIRFRLAVIFALVGTGLCFLQGVLGIG